jgi:hypothetical protein
MVNDEKDNIIVRWGEVSLNASATAYISDFDVMGTEEGDAETKIKALSEFREWWLDEHGHNRAPIVTFTLLVDRPEENQAEIVRRIEKLCIQYGVDFDLRSIDY